MNKTSTQSEYVIESTITKSEPSISLDEVIESSRKTNENKTYYGVYSTELVFDEEHDIFCIQHPYEKDYVIPVTKTIVPIGMNDAGSEVLVSFHGGNVYQPIITGKIRNLMPSETEIDLSNPSLVNVGMDKQEKIVFKADKEIVLECGKSSITLTKAGKVLIRGAYLLSRSTGVNKIKGGSVQLN